MDVRLAIPPATLEEINNEIKELFRHMSYRPTAVGIVENEKGQILLVKSRKGSRWGFPQGGIKKSEDAVEALLRELEEETGVVPSQLEIRAHCLSDLLDTPGRGRDGFSRGKRYYYFYLKYRGPSEIRIQRSEITEYRWDSRLVVKKFLEGFDEERYKQKQISLLKALAKLPSRVVLL